ncbi:MAG TPA: BamA/TamA family outer membrane protein [Ohtaekwangia sp.]
MRPLLVLFISLLTIPALCQDKVFTVFLIGDAGELYLPGNGLQESIRKNYAESTPSAVIFLGDNIYPKGMPSVGEPGRNSAETILRNQINLFYGLNTEQFFIPGNHDWKKGKPGGWDRILNQQQWIDSLHNSRIHFLPQGGCPGPVEVKLHENLILVILDSQWFLHPWLKPEGEDSPCDVKQPAEAVVRLEEILERNRNKKVLVAAHHPIYTYGEHGGVFTWKDHLFPLRDLNKKLYIPLPVIGSLYPVYRSVFGDIQDTAHPYNKRYRTLITELLEKYPGTIYANGHEHALQYSWKDSIHYVTSGSGVKNTYVRKKGYAKYVSSSIGYAKLDVFADGSSAIQYIEVGKSDSAYQVNLKPLAVHDSVVDNALPDFSKTVSSQASNRYQAGRWRRFMLGTNYRDEWKQKLEVPLFDIGSKDLKIVQRGGGMQTLSLRLADSVDNEYTLRSIEKYPEKAVPEILQKTFAQDLVQDQISAAHPYGALVVPYLAEAAGVYHSNPSVVFIPDDPRLGMYRKDFANTLALFEERPSGDGKGKPFFGNADKIISTDKVLERLAEDNSHQVDQRFVARSRLFDIVIGDWDRHDDQWRWAVFKEKKSEHYRPIPRDRDQAFFLSDGWLSGLWSRRWALPKFEGFHDQVRWVPGFMFNARYFDRSFLNEVPAEVWLEEAKDLQRNLTDEAIENSILHFPEPVFKLHGEEIIRKLKSRRDHLTQYAMDHYTWLSHEVDVPGSNKPELFEVDVKGGDLLLSVYKINKNGEKSGKIYERTFHERETRELRLFGMGGDDIFQVKGDANKIKIRIIGGDGMDSVINTSHERIRLYDLNNGVGVSTWKNIANNTSTDPAVNTYDRKSFKYPRFAPLVYGNFNYDDGLFIGGGFLYTTHGFRKSPYKSQHIFLASYAILTSSYNFQYDGRFNQVFGQWGLKLDVDLKGPNFVNNFFGWGNETEYDDEIDEAPGNDNLERPVDYYRIRLQQIEVQASLTHKLGNKGFLEFGPIVQRVEIEEPLEDNRFINEYAATVPEPVFEVPKTFGGIQWKAGIDNRDDPRIPTRGFYLVERSVFLKGIETDARDYSSHFAALSLFQTFRLPARVTFAVRVGGGINSATNEIYQAQILDGKTELRGYRKTRFYGDSKFFTNSEVRFRLARIRTYLFPATLGINGFYDIGRIWYKDANGVDPSTEDGSSSEWHKGIGGGLWFTPFNITVLSAEWAHSTDGNMFYIRLGFLF